MSERTRSNGQGLTRKAHAAAVRAGCSRDATKLLLLLAHARAASSPTVRELGARLGSLQPPALDQLLSELTTARLRYAAWQASKHRRDDYRLLFVNGHRFLPKYGHRFSPPAAIFSPHWWP
jgi:hypothetical protein